MAYVKLHQELFESTIWQEDVVTRLAWITLLLMANKEGEVYASVPGVAARIGVTIKEAEQALEKFLSPDPYSRTQDDEGRRIEVIDGGWSLLNYEKYRNKASLSDVREQARLRQQRFRDKAKRNAKPVTSNANSVTNNARITLDPYKAEAEAESKEYRADRAEKDSTLSKNPPKVPRKKSIQYSDDFTTWWKAYPGNGSKLKAFEAWKKLEGAPDFPSPAELIAILKAQISNKAECAKTGVFHPEFKNAEGYLKDRRWEDKLIVANPTPPRPPRARPENPTWD